MTQGHEVGTTEQISPPPQKATRQTVKREEANGSRLRSHVEESTEEMSAEFAGDRCFCVLPSSSMIRATPGEHYAHVADFTTSM